MFLHSILLYVSCELANKMPETRLFSVLLFPSTLSPVSSCLYTFVSIPDIDFAPCLDAMSRFLMFTDLLIRWCLSTQLFDNSQWCILDIFCVSVSSVSLEEICPAEGVQTPIAVSLHELESCCQGNNKHNYTWVSNFFFIWSLQGLLTNWIRKLNSKGSPSVRTSKIQRSEYRQLIC